MRKEASLEQWKDLYEAATKLKEIKPWEQFWDMDLIGIQRQKEEDTVFFCIMGRGGDCCGIAAYEGYAGLNQLMMLVMQEQLNLSPEYAMFNQRNLTCYWGNRDELTDKQRKIIKDLGYSYRGKNQWLHFMSYEPGYYPFNLDADEVQRMSGYLQDLLGVLDSYKDSELKVDFEHGHMLLALPGKDSASWNLRDKPLPFVSYQLGALMITDEVLLSDLAKTPKSMIALEADIACLGIRVTDKKYDRPASPSMVMFGDAKSGMILNSDMVEPDEDPRIEFAQKVIDFIFQYGRPQEIRVSNDITEACLEQICEVCGIKLRRVKRLRGLEEFKEAMWGRTGR